MLDQDTHTFRGNSQQQQTSGKVSSASSSQARGGHHPSDGMTVPSGHSSPDLSSFHSLAGFLGDKDPDAAGNLGTGPSWTHCG